MAEGDRNRIFSKLANGRFDVQLLFVDVDVFLCEQLGQMHRGHRTEKSPVVAGFDGNIQNKFRKGPGKSRKVFVFLLRFFPYLFLPDLKSRQFFFASKNAKILGKEKVSGITGRDGDKIARVPEVLDFLF